MLDVFIGYHFLFNNFAHTYVYSHTCTHTKTHTCTRACMYTHTHRHSGYSLYHILLPPGISIFTISLLNIHDFSFTLCHTQFYKVHLCECWVGITHYNLVGSFISGYTTEIGVSLSNRTQCKIVKQLAYWAPSLLYARVLIRSISAEPVQKAAAPVILWLQQLCLTLQIDQRS